MNTHRKEQKFALYQKIIVLLLFTIVSFLYKSTPPSPLPFLLSASPPPVCLHFKVYGPNLLALTLSLRPAIPLFRPPTRHFTYTPPAYSDPAHRCILYSINSVVQTSQIKYHQFVYLELNPHHIGGNSSNS